MKILLVSSEVAPFSKTGGLADVAGALPRVLGELSDHDVRVISPLYKMTKAGSFRIERVREIKNVAGFEDIAPFELLQTRLGNTIFYFIGKDEYFDRDGLYGTPQGGYEDNAERFSFFCRAVLACMVDIKFYPDIIHINDWETALIPLYKNANLKETHPLRKNKVLFTIHNLAYQGLFAKVTTADIGLSEELLEPLEHGGQISFIKSGILYSDAISTVSKKYAEEILTLEFGCGLDEVLKKRKKDLYGILNGVDYSKWNPETDKLIPENYDAETLEKKLTCKIELLKKMRLDLPAEAPLIGFVGRLAEQKGIDIIIDAIDEMVKSGINFILLGKGEDRYEGVLKRIAEEKTGKVGISLAFDNKLAHMIEAGVDMFVMPSRYEPCGLNQMYSLKYGTIPIVRATGGLDDTIIDYSGNSERGNGFKFERAVREDFIHAIKRARKIFDVKREWRKLQKRGMELDFCWKHAAREYIALYKEILEKR